MSIDLSNILSNPDDDGPRLAVARDLRAEGDPRGELIVAQCALSSCPPDDHATRDALTARTKELLAIHEEAWLAPLGLHPKEARWSRGFVEGVALTPGRLDAIGARLVGGAPVRTLELVGLGGARRGDAFASALDHPLCRQITSLVVRGVELGPAGAHVLRNATHLGGLRALRLRFSRIGREGARALAAASHLENLEVLDLYGGGIGAEGTRALARAPHLAGLRELDLGDWEFANKGYPDDLVGSSGAHHIAAATHMTRLRSLSLQWSEIDAHGAHALAAAPHLARLRTLRITGNRIKRAGMRALTRRMTDLRYLDARKTHLDHDGLREVLAPLRRIESLDLGDNELDHASSSAARAVTEAPSLGTLRELWLFASDVDDGALRDLVRAPHLARLTTLALVRNAITAEGARAITASACAPRLERLDLANNDLGPEGARVLAEGTRLARLATLDVQHCALGAAGVQLLEDALHLARCQVLSADNGTG